MKKEVEIFLPKNFEPEHHYYAKALNAQIHPMVGHFFHLHKQQIIQRYLHLNPRVQEKSLREILDYKAKHFFWGGCDLFYVTTETGNRSMVVIETNSCPSGQKSMPPIDDWDEHRGYRLLIENSFIPQMKSRRLIEGALAVIYDKNHMESSGYAATLADLTGEKVYLIPNSGGDEFCHFEDGILYLKQPKKKKIAIRAAFRYVTQKPWDRIPVKTKTFIYNPTLVCLAGGRNKLLANKAYEIFNEEKKASGLQLHFPQTIRDVKKRDVPAWVKKWGGVAVIKNPYSNAGQGVYTITNEAELEKFMQTEHEYDQFIVQSLIGHYLWSSMSGSGRFFHVGTIPNKKNKIYAADLRMMVYATSEGFRPCALYARRTRKPLEEKIPEGLTSWDVLGTNLSVKTGEGAWDSDTSRLLLMDRKDFNTLGIGTDDLVEAYIQTIQAIIAIDKMAATLLNTKGEFKLSLFGELDNDPHLLQEILLEK
ncbi:MAG: hypothetical protein JNM93_01480 [Bacteriovoracaceae bacterium]|nr:hypothetical protein [Bacteriovoracaceae bacterium]